MSRIPTPTTIEAAPEASRPLLQQVNSMLGSVPNIFRMVSNSPAALEGYLGIFGALRKGELATATQERIALAIAEFNNCSYCLAAHTYLAKNLVKLSSEEIAANRQGKSTDPKADAAVKFAVKVATNRGRVLDTDLAVVRAAGFSDAEIVEIVQHVAFNVWTNYVNELAQTEIDFPAVDEAVA